MEMIGMNETIAKISSVDGNNSIMFAGHLLIIFYCLIFIFGFLGNSAVIYVGIRKKKYRNVTNCYVINLALADILFLTISIPYTTYLGLINTYPFGETICKIYMYLAYVFLLATCNTIAAMSIDRYFYIVLPRWKLRWRTPRNALIICFIIWISSLTLVIPYHIITSNLKTCSINDDKNFFICFLVFCSYYAIPVLIIIVCYTKLAMHIIKSHRLMLSQMNMKKIPESLQKKRRRVTRMVIILTLVFAICWLPIHILELMKCADSSLLYALIRLSPKVLYTIRAVSHALSYFNSCLNPYLYALLNRNFCFDLIDIIPSWMIYCKQSNLFQTRITLPNTNIISSTTIPNEILLKRKSNDDDDDDDDDYEIYYHGTNKQTNIDASCQVDLLGT